MAQYTATKYTCDHCGKALPTFKNNLDIAISKSESNIGWSRLHIKIEHHHGSHNDGQRDDADVCQECAIKLLTNALEQVKKGVRATQSTESIYEEAWHNPK